MANETKTECTGFFGPEKKGIQKGVLGGLAMIVIAVVWFVLGYTAGIIFFYPPVLLLIGVYAVIKGLITGNLNGDNENNEITNCEFDASETTPIKH